MSTRNLYFYFLAVFLTIVISTGCSNNSDWNPVTMRNDIDDSSPVDQILLDNICADISAPAIFGIYEIEFDIANLTADICPIRICDFLGDSYHVNITPYLSAVPCSDCINISSIAINGDFLDVDIQTKHPYQPDTRYDLHVFDMRGIVVSGDNVRHFENIGIDFDGNGIYETHASGNIDFLVHPDGFTSFYDAAVEDYLGKEFEGNICPYKNLWVNPATTPPDSNYDPSIESQYGFTDLQHPTGHNVFPMGSGFDNPLATTSFRLDFSNLENTRMILILEASYGNTTLKLTRKEPRFFLPEFHRKDAWFVGANLVSNDLIENNPATTAVLRVEVMDWQAGCTPTDGWNYFESKLTETRFASDIKDVLIDIPGVLNNRIDLTLADIQSGDGSPSAPYVWQVEFANEAQAPFGTYWGLVAVRDELEGSINAPWGISENVLLPIHLQDITTYQVFDVYIEQFNVPPVADLADSDADNVVDSGAIVNFQPGILTDDPDGEIIRYEYDLDYNGTDFAVNLTQNTGDLDFGNPISHQFINTSGSDSYVTIALRVTDNGAQGLTDIDSTTFTVHPTAGLYIYEDFETTLGASLPSDWGVAGRYSQSYFLNTLGEGCRNTSWRWGVTVNTIQCDDGESHFLNESGNANPDMDEGYVYQNRATIAYTPEFTIPPTGATLTISHWFDFTYEEVITNTIFRDGGQPILSVENPGTVDWSDFCNSEELNNHPLRSLSIIGGPVGYGFLIGNVSGNHPFNGWSCHTGDSDGWITSMYSIPSIFAGQVVRIGFLFGSDDLRISIANDCDPNDISPTINPEPGWRINWVRIESN